MKRSAYSVAVVGATGLVGREIVATLEQRQFPLAALQLYASVHSAGEEVRCGDVTTRVELLERARFDQSDVVFLTAGTQISAEWITRATEDGAVVIDTSQLFADDPDVPLVVPEVNAADIGAYAGRGLIASPDPPAIALAVVLHPIHAAATIRRLVATTFEPASGAGGRGVEELQRQTVDLMSGRSVEQECFPHRIAFNVFPQIGELLAGNISSAERQTIGAICRLLGEPVPLTSVTRVLVPLFYGEAIAVNIETVEELTVAAAHEVLRDAPGVLLLDEPSEQLYPTSGGAVGQDATAVGRIRTDETAHVLDAWIALDNTRKGAAVNAVQIAELLIREYL